MVSLELTNSYGLYPSHDTLQVPTLLDPFTHHCQHGRNNSQHYWPRNIGSSCVRFHVALGERSALDDLRSHQSRINCILFSSYDLISSGRLQQVKMQENYKNSGRVSIRKVVVFGRFQL